MDDAEAQERLEASRAGLPTALAAVGPQPVDLMPKPTPRYLHETAAIEDVDPEQMMRDRRTP